MTAFLRQLSLALLVTSATAGLALANVAPLPDAVPSASAETIAAARAFMTSPSRAQSYALSNDKTLLVQRFHQSMSVRYGDRSMPVHYDGQGNFVSEDGLLRMKFLPSPDGEPDTVSLSIPATWR